MYNARITKLGFVFLVIFLPFIKAQDDLKYGDTIYIQSMAKEHVWMKEDLYLPPHKIGTLVDYQLKKMVGNALVDIEKNPADELGYQFIFTGKTGCLKYGDKVQVRSNVENPDTGGTIVGASGMVGNRSFKRHHHTLILRSEEGNGDPDQKDSRSTECIKEKSSVFLQITQKKNWLRYNPDWYHMVVKNCLTCDTTERKKDVGEFLWKLRLDMGSGDRCDSVGNFCQLKTYFAYGLKSKWKSLEDWCKSNLSSTNDYCISWRKNGRAYGVIYTSYNEAKVKYDSLDGGSYATILAGFEIVWASS